MNLKPNTIYYKVNIRIPDGEPVDIAYPGFAGFYHINGDIFVPEFYLTEEQYIKRFDRCVEEHIKSEIRQNIEFFELGHDVFEKDEDGNPIESTWDWVPGTIEPSKFFMRSVPYHNTIVMEVRTDSEGKINA